MTSRPEFTVVGRSERKVDGRALVTGKPVYVADLQLPDLESCELDSPAGADPGANPEQPQEAGLDKSRDPAERGGVSDGPTSRGSE